MITFFSAIVLGVVEGLTEFLPISSTAHLILTSRLLGITQSEFVKTFEIMIQSGAIFAVIILYWKKFLNLELLKNIIVAFIPTALIGFLLYKIIKGYFLESFGLILAALFLGGVILVYFERFLKSGEETTLETLTYKKSFLIGLIQSLAVIPGVSRSGATIVGGRFLGLSREAIVEFSFLLAVPTILAATLLDLLQNFELFTREQIGVLSVGFIVSFITALLSIKFFLSYIKKHSFKVFGVYRILLALVFGLFLLF